MLRGTIELFNEQRGDGIFRSDEGEMLYFHCVNIADGTRSINPGARAEGRRRVGLLGRDELTEVREDLG